MPSSLGRLAALWVFGAALLFPGPGPAARGGEDQGLAKPDLALSGAGPSDGVAAQARSRSGLRARLTRPAPLRVRLALGAASSVPVLPGAWSDALQARGASLSPALRRGHCPPRAPPC